MYFDTADPTTTSTTTTTTTTTEQPTNDANSVTTTSHQQTSAAEGTTSVLDDTTGDLTTSFIQLEMTSQSRNVTSEHLTSTNNEVQTPTTTSQPGKVRLWARCTVGE